MEGSILLDASNAMRWEQWIKVKSSILYCERDKINIMRRVQLCIEEMRAMRGGDENNASNVQKNCFIVCCMRSKSST